MATKKTTKSATRKGAAKHSARARKGSAKAAKKAQPKLSQMAAAVKVLKQSRKPLTCTQMVEQMAKKKLWTSPGGKTPEQTLYASILRDIQKHGDESQFQKVDRGLFTLASK
jgi:hypothetical protein